MKKAIALHIFIIFFLALQLLLTGLGAPVSAEDDKFRWRRMDTPGSVAGKNDIVSPCEINRLAIGADGMAFYAVDTA